MLPTLISTWLDDVVVPGNTYVLMNFFFYVIFVYFISRNILEEKESTANALSGALSAYLTHWLSLRIFILLYGNDGTWFFQYS